MEKVLDSGYAFDKEDFEIIKKSWEKKNHKAKVKRVKTDTKGLIMYIVECDVKNLKISY